MQCTVHMAPAATAVDLVMTKPQIKPTFKQEIKMHTVEPHDPFPHLQYA